MFQTVIYKAGICSCSELSTISTFFNNRCCPSVPTKLMSAAKLNTISTIEKSTEKQTFTHKRDSLKNF